MKPKFDPRAIIKHMTLIIAAKATDGLVMAADGRAVTPSRGFPYVSNQKKVFRANDHVGLLGGGEPYFVSSVIRRLQATPLDDASQVADKIVTAILSELQRRANRFLIPIAVMQQSMDFTIVTCGYDKDDQGNFTIKKIYISNNQDPYSQDRTEPFYCGGVDEPSNFLFRSFYKDTHTLADVTELAVLSLTETIKLYAAVGDPIDVLQLKEDGTSHKLSATEKSRIATASNAILQQMKNLF